jgi:hypothetical protein
MGLERGRYYTRSRRENGRVVREYVGSGYIAKLAAQLDALQRSEREDKRETERAMRAELAAHDDQLNEFVELTEELARAALFAAGYRQHNRGAWRKQRVCHETES